MNLMEMVRDVHIRQSLRFDIFNGGETAVSGARIEPK